MSESKEEIVSLNPEEIYTTESTVYEDGLESANLNEPIYFGKDIKGRPYVNDGNHRAKKPYLNTLN